MIIKINHITQEKKTTKKQTKKKKKMDKIYLCTLQIRTGMSRRRV